MKGNEQFSALLIRSRTNLALVLIVEQGPLCMTCYNLDYSLFPFGAVALVRPLCSRHVAYIVTSTALLAANPA